MAARPHRQLVEAGMFVRVGEGEPARGRPPLLFVHGLGESGLCFERIAARPEIASRPHLIPDLPGYGRSAWLDEPLRLAEQADRLADWLARRDAPEVVVIGHSMGGVVALLLAERHPQRVVAVIDVDGNKTSPDCAFSGLAAARACDDFVSGGFDALRDEVYRNGVEDEALRGYYASLRLADPRAYHLNSGELVAMSAAGDLAVRLAALSVPVLYIAGTPRGASEGSIEALAAADVAVETIAPSGHWPFIDQPDAFVAALERFLANGLAVRR